MRVYGQNVVTNEVFDYDDVIRVDFDKQAAILKRPNGEYTAVDPKSLHLIE